jgi:phosphomannomutase
MPDRTGRLLVRYSGTEPKVRVMIDGEDQNEIKTLADDLAGIIRENLGYHYGPDICWQYQVAN